jgi:ATPase family associated with various cellular activities (AAA)
MATYTKPGRGQRGRGLALTHEVGVAALADAEFTSLVVERALSHTVETRWPTAAETLQCLAPHAITTTRARRVEAVLLDLASRFGSGSCALVKLRRGTAHIQIGACDQAVAEEIELWLRGALPALDVSGVRELPVRFWTCSPHGAISTSRMIKVPTFADVEENYPRGVRDELERLVDPAFGPGEDGQLILWQGQPGTGKTYALRALAWEWRNWCKLDYVIDPEVFFGQRADYMVDVLLDDDSHVESGDPTGPEQGKWRLLVLEDTGELLAADAKERTGQGLSRLLNLVDGIVGQGLRLLVLVTTNEPLRRVHPAVARPGRCATQIEFVPFDPDESAAWLADRGGPPTELAAATLAQLFAHLRGHVFASDAPVGFAR